MTDNSAQVFSKSKFEYFFIKYTAALGIAATILILEIYWLCFGKKQDVIALLFVIIAFFAIYIVERFLFSKFAYSIIVSEKGDLFTFKMFFGDRTYHVSIDDMETIYINFYVTFYFKGKKIVYKGVEDKKLIDFLRKGKKAKCGGAWKWIAG